MSKTVYRGVTYDSAAVKDAFKCWWKSIHSKEMKLTYRGKKYSSLDVEKSALV